MKKLLLLFLISQLLTSCATILSGKFDTVKVKAGKPVHAKVYLNGNYVGEAPIKVRLAKDENNIIEIRADGYEPMAVQMRRRFAWGFAVADVCFGVVPLVVDLLTGDIYKLKPNKIRYDLKPIQK